MNIWSDSSLTRYKDYLTLAKVEIADWVGFWNKILLNTFSYWLLILAAIYLKFSIITLYVYLRKGSLLTLPSFKKFLLAELDPTTLLSSFLSYAFIMSSCLTSANYLIFPSSSLRLRLAPIVLEGEELSLSGLIFFED